MPASSRELLEGAHNPSTLFFTLMCLRAAPRLDAGEEIEDLLRVNRLGEDGEFVVRRD